MKSYANWDKPGVYVEALAQTYTKKMDRTYPDIEIQREGTLFLVWSKTDLGAAWIGNNVDTENATWFGQALVVEHRFIAELAQGMIDAGLVVK